MDNLIPSVHFLPLFIINKHNVLMNKMINNDHIFNELWEGGKDRSI